MTPRNNVDAIFLITPHPFVFYQKLYSGYVKEERTTLSKDSTAEKAWKGYLICNEAIIDPNNAWVEAQSLISSQLDAGISKSQVLYWVMTRDGFLSSTTTPTSQLSGGSSRSSGSTSASSVSNAQTSGASVPKKTSSPNCEDNSMCSEEMLEGMCCPTNEGVFLGCCD